MKTAISLPDEDFERIASRTGMSRYGFCRREHPESVRGEDARSVTSTGLTETAVVHGRLLFMVAAGAQAPFWRASAIH
jgi:hypothetical protein